MPGTAMNVGCTISHLILPTASNAGVLLAIYRWGNRGLERLSNLLKVVEAKWEPNPGSLGSSVHCSNSLQAFNQPVVSEHILCAEYCLMCYAFKICCPIIIQYSGK